jgi:hypothetical protein
LVPNPATADEFVAEDFGEDGRDELTLDTGSSAFFVYGLCALVERLGRAGTECRVYARGP